MKFTVLVENSNSCSFAGEHGLSLYIENKTKSYLLDVGQSSLFLENAKKLSLSLKNLDGVICSHGHFDHGNGLPYFFEENKENTVYASVNVFREYYSNSKGILHYIGFVYGMEKYRDRFTLINQDTKIDGAVLILDSSHAEMGQKRGLFVYDGQEYIPDDLTHELSLVFDDPRGLIVFNSCSHLGIENIVSHVKKVMHKKVFAYVGGLHLKSPLITEEEILEIAHFINEHLDLVYTGHCTGSRAMEILCRICKEKIMELKTGNTYVI